MTAEELQEAAAELTHLQTMALQAVWPSDAQHSIPGPADASLPSSDFPGGYDTLPNSARSLHGVQSQSSEVHEIQRQRSRGKRTEEDSATACRPARRQYPANDQASGSDQRPQVNPPSRTLASASLVAKMAQLLLRHTDALNGLEQSTSWVMFQGTAPPLTVVELQARVGAEWQQVKATNPSAVTQPLRVTLWQTWASELVKRIQALNDDPTQRQEAARLNILTEPDCFKYVKWNPTTRAMENRDELAPLTTKEVLDMLKETIVLCKEEGVVTNYHPMRKLTPNMAGAAVTFALILGLREARAYRMWTIIENLAGNAALQLVATTIRREKRGRSHRARASTAEAQLWIRSLSLHNRSNDCCANATLLAILWTSAQYAGLEDVSTRPSLQEDINKLRFSGGTSQQLCLGQVFTSLA